MQYAIQFNNGEMCDEGPWDSRAEAEHFLSAEVGAPARVVALASATLASMVEGDHIDARAMLAIDVARYWRQRDGAKGFAALPHGDQVDVEAVRHYVETKCGEPLL